MSGICGIVRFDGQAVKKEEIQNMLDAMQNRGNDTEGIWIDGNVGFGHKMLWTTPESLHENQPLISQDNNLVITADARIDNRDELFEKLEINENDFDMVTDIDLVLWSYQKWGEDCAKYLIGDFSFAIWDKLKKTLFAIRDKIGVKQFVYTKSSNRLIFASDISTLFILNDFKKQININSIENIFINDNMKLIDPNNTFFNNVFRLPAASILEVKNKNILIKKYWDPADIQINNNSLEKNSQIFLSLLTQSIEARLRSAFPVGMELSGGMDSSTILSIAAKLDSNPIKSFALQFGDMWCDESEYINEVVQHTQSPLFGIRADKLDYCEKYSLKNYYESMPDYPLDGFFLSMVATMERAGKENVRVLLTGQGGDHVTQGNPLFLHDWVKKEKVLQALLLLNKSKYPWRTVKQAIIKPFFSKNVLSVIRKMTFKPNPKSILINNRKVIDFTDIIDSKNFILESIKYEAQVILGSVQSLSFDEWHYNMAGKMNIEVRHPFYDSRLVEFALQIPKEQKYDFKSLKPFLKEATKGVLPEKIRLRNDKKVFDEPVIMQAMDHMTLNFLDNLELVSDGIIKKSIVKEIKNWYNNDNKKWKSLVWQIVCTEFWYKKQKKEK